MLGLINRLAGGDGIKHGLNILIYHRVLPAADPLFPGEVTAERFEWQMRLLSRHFNVLPLQEAVSRLASGTLPRAAAAITFDDGYADNLTVALPILQRYRLPATVFVATAYLDGGIMWNDRVIHAMRTVPAGRLDLQSCGLGVHEVGDLMSRQAAIRDLLGKLKYLEWQAREDRVNQLVGTLGITLPADMMLTTPQLKQLAAAKGVDIGGHTRTHPILSRLDAAAARAEIADGRAELETIVGYRPRLFAYPNGGPNQDYAAEHAAIVRELGFDAAVSTAWGAARPGADLFQLPRFTPWDLQPLRFSLRLASNYRRDSYALA